MSAPGVQDLAAVLENYGVSVLPIPAGLPADARAGLLDQALDLINGVRDEGGRITVHYQDGAEWPLVADELAAGAQVGVLRDVPMELLLVVRREVVS